MTAAAALTDLHRSALAELGSVGAGNAATALAQALGTRFGLTPSRVDLAAVARGEDDAREVAALHMAISGAAPADMLVVFDRAEAATFARRFLAQFGAADATDDLVDASLSEIANIVAGSYLTALIGMLGVELMPSTPRLLRGPLDAVVEQVLGADRAADPRAFVIANGFVGEHGAIDARCLLLPRDPSLDAYLRAFGVER